MVPSRQSCFAALAAGLLWLCGVPPAHAMHAWPSDGVQNIPISTVKTRVGDFSFAASGRLPWRHELSPANTPGSRGCGYEMASGRAFWNERDPNWYTFVGGEPIMGFDADGRLATTAVNYSVGLGQGFLQGLTGISTGNPTDTANYNGQLTGRDLSAVVSAWLVAQGATITGGGSAVMAGSLAVEGVSVGTATPAAVPVLVGGTGITAAGAVETGIGAYGLYNFMNLTPLQSPSNDSGGGGSQDSSDQGSTSGQNPTSNDSGYVDLTDAQGSQHILDGDATGGGHAPGTGIPGKSEFPASWSNDQILDTISDISTDPDQVWSPPDSRGYTTTTATVDGVDIKVVYDTQNGRIVTGYPTNLPRNP